jgi:hypothetical protein
MLETLATSKAARQQTGQFQIQLFTLNTPKTREEIAQELRAKGHNIGPEQIIPGDHTPIHLDVTAMTKDGRVET